MKRIRQRIHPSRAGVSLVEILVAIVIAGVMGGMVFHLIITTGRTSKSQTSQLTRAMQARILMEKICSALENVPSPLITGGVGISGKSRQIDSIDADSVQIPRADFTGQGKDLRVEMSEICYMVEKVVKDGQPVTIIKTRQDRQVDGKVDGPERDISMENSNQQVHLNLRYRADRALNAAKGWKDNWSEKDPLPKAIEVTVSIEDLTAKSFSDVPERVTLSRVITPRTAIAF